MVATGVNPDTNLMEIMEIKEHPWFVGVQFHPEYKSTVLNPHPLFVRFIAATLENKKNKVIFRPSEPKGNSRTKKGVP